MRLVFYYQQHNIFNQEAFSSTILNFHHCSLLAAETHKSPPAKAYRVSVKLGDTSRPSFESLPELHPWSMEYKILFEIIDRNNKHRITHEGKHHKY